MLRKCERENRSAARESLGRGAVLDIVRRGKRERRVMMLLPVVPIEEVLAECTRILERAEARRKIGPILEARG